MTEELLTREGYAVLRAYSGTEALLLLERRRPDLILLDLMLPGLSGEALLPAVREIPVIIVSAKTDADEKAALLLGGAADYVTKPFATKELLARISIRLREAPKKAPLLAYGAIVMDPETREVTVGGSPVRLTRTEYAILRLLLQNPAQVIPKSTLLDRISLETPDCVESSLKVHISNLRKKLREKDGQDHIEAVWGIGFRLRGGEARKDGAR